MIICAANSGTAAGETGFAPSWRHIWRYDMIAIDFGNLCFNAAVSEQNISAVVAPKSVYSSLDDFITAALLFLDSDERFCSDWTELYKNRTNLPASEEDLAWMKSRLEEMNQRVTVLHEPVTRAVNLIPPKWNDLSLGLETDSEYILYLWGTSA